MKQCLMLQGAAQAGLIWMQARLDRSDWYVITLLLCMVSVAYVVWRTTRFAGLNTQRKGAVQLRRLLAAVVESSSDAVITVSMENQILSWNNGAEKLFGYTTAEAVGQSILMLRTPEHFKEDSLIRGRVEENERADRATSFDAVRLRKDGTLVHVSIAVSPVRNGKGVVFARSVVARDISPTKVLEAALRASEMQFEAMANGIPNLATMAEPDGTVFWYNQRWYDYTGTTASQMALGSWHQFHDPAVAHIVLADWASAIAKGDPFETEFPLLGVDGGWRTFLTRVMPLKDGAGEVVRWFGTFTDISDRKEAQDRLAGQTQALLASQQALEAQTLVLAAKTSELEATNQELHTFSYSVSHDLRSPLRHIGGFARIISEDYGAVLPPQANEHLERIQSSVIRATMMVDGLLNLTKLGRRSLKLGMVAMNTLVDEVMPMVQGECDGRKVEWCVHSLPTIECDHVLMCEVMQNLLSNAIKYTRGRNPAVIEIGSVEALHHPPVIFVRDNGAGFDMRYASRLFGVFQRLHTDAEFEGTGIGLATVQRIVQRHGGRVWAEAEPDLGATFFFTCDGSAGEGSDESHEVAR